MKRILAAVATLAGLSGCYGTTYVDTTPGYTTTTEYAPYDDPGPVTVTVAPPPLRYEPVSSCGYGAVWFPGRWEFRNSWYWARGYCTESRPGYVYVAPRYVNGVYYRAHWGRVGGGYYGGSTYVPPPGPVVRPAPGYGGGYVAPAPVRPAPVYGGGGYVAPAPVRPAPAYGGGGYVAPAPAPVRPAPAYGGGGYVAPAPVRPAPAPGSVYVPPPGGGVRPAPAPYRPPVAPPYHR